MKKTLLKTLMGLALLLIPGVIFAQTAPPLGNAAAFVLFTTNGAMTGSGTMYLTHLTGNVGSNLAGSVTGFGNVDGVMHTADVATALTVPDVISLYTTLSTAIPTGPLASPFGGGTTLLPGVYHAVGAATLSGTLILDGQGNPNSLFIFQIGGVFSASSLSKIKLINGALACNVFWQVAGAINVGSGTTIRGTMVANGQIDMTSTLDTLEGRALAMNAAVLVSQLVAYTPIGCGSPYQTGPAAPAMLDSTAAYGVFSSIGAVTSTPISYVIGNVGGNSAAPTGFNPLNVTGTIHSMDPSTAAAAGDLTNIYNYLVALPADIQLMDPANFGHDLVLTPHSYQLTGITQLTGNLILNAEGNANAVFVIKINGSFTTTTVSKIVLINGAQAKNVYWKVDGEVDIYSNSVFNGTLIVAGAISLETGDTLNGRAMTIGGAVAINGSYVKIIPKSCLAPVIGGTKSVCVGSTTLLTDSTTGGKWTSSDTTIAIIDSNSGIATGRAPGTSIITYTTLPGCTNTTNLTVNGLPSAITGPSTVCVSDSITLVDTTVGGTWSSNNNAIATIGSLTGKVHGIAPGRDTLNYTSAAGCRVSKTVTVNALSNAGVINGPSNMCVGSVVVYTDTASGGVWSSSNANATVVGGTVTAILTGIDTIRYTVTNVCGIATATKIITIGTSANAGTITGPTNVCVGNQITLTDAVTGGIWSSSNANATVSITGVVTGMTAGQDTISYTVTNTCGTSVATKALTLDPLPNAGSITGPSTVCVGSSISLTDAVAGGIWSSSNVNATVAGGIVTGVSSGLDTITYSVTTVCGTATTTKIITIGTSGSAGTITGPSSVCIGSQITLTDGVTGGTWTSSNTNATVSTTGVVTGMTAGTSTISYSVTNACGTNSATATITVDPLSNAGSISGPSTVCVGSSITLTDPVSGGTWSSSNANATVTGGIVTGVSTGVDTISYTVSGVCGSATATKTITVNTLPNAGTITGPSVVCVGSSITLSNTVTGGVWTSSNTNATVIGGVVTGITAGSDTITYSVINTCGISATTKIVTVNPLPNAGSISGPSSVCVGGSITLIDGVSGGLWTSSNTNASVSGGVVTGFTAGTSNISYTVSNSCGFASSTHAITILPLTNAGTITGPSAVCVASTIALSDAVSGGTWSSTYSTATVGSTGIVTGMTTGIDTINYAVSGVCGTTVTSKIININPLPNAGTITGVSSVCEGSIITLTDLVPGGVWNSSNANATVSGGNVNGVTAGVAIISYSVSNSCGTADAIFPITINPLPIAGTISGPSSVCVGLAITMTSSVAFGTWSSSNANATVTGGIVTGVTAGTANILYTISNICGTIAATKAITVNPLPFAGTIAGPASVCAGSTITLSNIATGGSWSASNTNASVFNGVVAGIIPGIDTIRYIVTNVCGTASTTKIITINPLPDAGTITGASAICVGTTSILTDLQSGGTWSSNNANVTVTPSGTISGVTVGSAIISYTVTNVCGTDRATRTIVVNPIPFVPVITTQAPGNACMGTMYQNFGTINAPQVGTKYSWTAVNAIVWAQGTDRQYALVNFDSAGIASVTLNATYTSTGCSNRSAAVVVNVSTTASHTDEVSYFNNHFVCTPADNSSYQWGYDDASTLDSTLLAGEINQDYINFTPDFNNKKYWAMTTSGSCMQKTYYRVPAGVENINASTMLSVYPNPASNTINVTVSASITGGVEYEIVNMMGQTISKVQADNSKTEINIAELPAGSYMVVCYNDGTKIATARFIKN